MTVSPLRQHLLALLPLLFLSACAAGPTLISTAPDRDVLVDGDLVEWIDHLTEIADTRLRVGVKHDAEFVYLAVLSTQRNTVQQIIGNGLTIWFDSTRSRTKAAGFRYPVGVENLTPVPASTDEDRMEQLRRATAALDLYFEPEKPVRRQAASLPGVLAASGFEFGAFTMEVRIPRAALSADGLWLPTAADGSIWLGFETGGGRDAPASEPERTPSDARGRTGGIGAVGRDYGGQGAGPAGMYFGPIDTWIRVALN